MDFTHALVFFVVCLVVVTLLVLNSTAALSDETEGGKSSYVIDWSNRRSESELNKRDCDLEFIYSMLDEQCDAVCKPPSVYRSRHGVCVNVLAFDSETVENECDPKRGVLAYLIGDPEFGRTSLRCLSIDPGIQPNDPRGRNIICDESATVDIDYLNSFPRMESCRCPDGTELAIVANTSTVRRHGVCIDRRASSFFATSGLLV